MSEPTASTTTSTTTSTVTTSLGDVVTVDRHAPASPASTSSPATVLFVAGAGPYRAVDPITTATAAALAAEHGVTALVHDRVGRGDSRTRADGTRIEGPVHLDRELAAVSALVEGARTPAAGGGGAGGGPVVLVGHSSGCSIAMAAAAGGLDVAGLVLWEAPLDPPQEHERVREWTEDVERLVVAGDLEAAMWEYMKDMPAEFREGAAASLGFETAVAQAGAYAADGESLVWASSAPLAELLDGVRVPVLALVGTTTFPGMPEAAQRVAAEVPGAASEEVAGAWHSWEPAAMADRLARFVDELPA